MAPGKLCWCWRSLCCQATVGAIFVLIVVIAIPIAATFGFVKEKWPEIQAAIQSQQQAARAASVPADGAKLP